MAKQHVLELKTELSKVKEVAQVAQPDQKRGAHKPLSEKEGERGSACDDARLRILHQQRARLRHRLGGMEVDGRPHWRAWSAR